MLYAIQVIVDMKSNDTYTFPTIEEVEKFLGIKNDYKNHVYYEGEDIFGTKHSLGSCEFVDEIYSRTDYEIKWGSEEI